jgi:hypothetical protein
MKIHARGFFGETRFWWIMDAFVYGTLALFAVPAGWLIWSGI